MGKGQWRRPGKHQAAADLAALYLEKLLALEQNYRGVEFEDEMVDMYPLCTFGNSTVAASIDTPLHAFLPFPHVDHLASGLGDRARGLGQRHAKRWKSSIASIDHQLVWVPWQRPGL